MPGNTKYINQIKTWEKIIFKKYENYNFNNNTHNRGSKRMILLIFSATIFVIKTTFYDQVHLTGATPISQKNKTTRTETESYHTIHAYK